MTDQTERAAEDRALAPYGTAGRLRLAAREIARLRAELEQARRERDEARRRVRVLEAALGASPCFACGSRIDSCPPCQCVTSSRQRNALAAPSAPAPGEGGGA
jgi:hypothetical protein